MRAIAHILIAKLYRKPIDARAGSPLPAIYTTSDAMVRQSERIRQTRGRKRIGTTAEGALYDLDEVFESLNTRFFFGLMGRPHADVERAYGEAAAGALRCGAQHDYGEPGVRPEGDAAVCD